MFLSCLLRKLWRNMQIWQLCFTISGNPAIGRFRNCPHSISHARKHIWRHQNHVYRSIKWQLMAKSGKNDHFWLFFSNFFRGGAKFLKSERPIFNRRQVECFGPKKYYLCRKLYPHQLPDTNIIYTTEYKNHLQNRESAVGWIGGGRWLKYGLFLWLTMSI